MSDKFTNKTDSFTYTEDIDHDLYWLMVVLMLEILDPEGNDLFRDPKVVLKDAATADEQACGYRAFYIDLDHRFTAEHMTAISWIPTSNSIAFRLAMDLNAIVVLTPPKHFRKHTDAVRQMKLLLQLLHRQFGFLLTDRKIVTTDETLSSYIHRYLNIKKDADYPVSRLSDTFIKLYSNLEIYLEGGSSGRLVKLIDCLAARSKETCLTNPDDTGMKELMTIRTEHLAGSRIYPIPRRPDEVMDLQPYDEDDDTDAAFWRALEKMNEEMGFPGQVDSLGLAVKILEMGRYDLEAPSPDFGNHEILVFKPALAEMTIYSSNSVNTAYMLMYVVDRAVLRGLFLKSEDLTKDLLVCSLDEEN